MNVILDTSIIVEYSIDGIKDFIINDDRVFLTDIILQEMDGHKNSEEAKGYNAREFFRQMGNSKSEKANLSDIVLKDNDYISKYTLSNGLEIYTIVRNRYNSRDINDSKIIEIAKDYNLKLITRDMAQSVRAKAMGVEVEVVMGDSVITKAKDEKDKSLTDEIMLEKIIAYFEKNNNKELAKEFMLFCKACDNIEFTFLRHSLIIKLYCIVSGINNWSNLTDIGYFDNFKITKRNQTSATNNIITTKNYSINKNSHQDFTHDPIYSNMPMNIYHQND